MVVGRDTRPRAIMDRMTCSVEGCEKEAEFRFGASGFLVWEMHAANERDEHRFVERDGRLYAEPNS